jgi:hypothetical protein
LHSRVGRRIVPFLVSVFGIDFDFALKGWLEGETERRIWSNFTRKLQLMTAPIPHHHTLTVIHPETIRLWRGRRSGWFGRAKPTFEQAVSSQKWEIGL